MQIGLVGQRVLQTNGLMRMKLTSNGKKLILCTAGGYLMVIHDLDLSTLDQGLFSFFFNLFPEYILTFSRLQSPDNRLGWLQTKHVW